MIKASFKICALILVCLCCKPAFAADSSYVFSLNRSQIEHLNLSNVADLIRYMPLFYSTSNGIATEMNIGAQGQQNIAIDIDGIPMLLHNNIPISLHSISLTNIEEIKVYLGRANSPVKNNAGIYIQMTSIPFEDKPWNLNARLGYGSLGDLQTGINGHLSNKKHSVGMGLNRQFEGAYKLNNERQTRWAASERYDLNLNYKFLVLPGLTLKANSNTSFLKAQQKGGVIEATSRVSDRYTRVIRNSTGLSLAANLSKIHKVKVNANTSSYASKLNYVDLDLSTGQSETNNVKNPLDSVKYRYNVLNTSLVGTHKVYNYVIGFEYSSLDDRVNKNINAFRTLNTDYSVFGQFNYRYKKYFDIGGGASFLTNSKSGNFFLTRAQIIAAPDQLVSFKSSFISSVSYAQFGKIFYPSTLTQTQETNNFLIAPMRNNTFTNVLRINKNNVRMNAGVVYTRFSEIAGLDFDQKWQNSNSSITTTTFFGLNIANNEYSVNSTFVLHGINTSVDDRGLNFFYPEVNLFLQGRIPVIKTTLNLSMRSLGNYPKLSEELGTTIFRENDAFTFLNISASKKLFANKLNMTFGVTNLLNNAEITRTQYQLLEFNRVNIFEDTQLIDRGRNIFLTLSYIWR